MRVRQATSMGLDASVACNCFARGIAAPPPHPEHVKLDDGDVHLDLPWEGHDAEWKAFRAWRARACAHPLMEAASERIGSWAMVRMFQEALAHLGWVHFPAIQAAFPEGNYGGVEAADAARWLAEIATFEALYRAPIVALIDSDTSAILFDHIAAYDGLFLYDSKDFDMGVDPRGLFARTRQEPQREHFRAMRIEQRPHGEGAELVDLDSDARLVIRSRIRRDGADVRRMHVAPVARDASAFAFTLTALKNVLEASIATGNPVRWG